MEVSLRLDSLGRLVRVGAHMGPYGPIYGPIWALMGPPGQVLEVS